MEHRGEIHQPPLEPGQRRHLTAVVHADVVGFSKLVGRNDVETMQRIKRLRASLVEPLLHQFGGRLLHTAGDAFLLTFASSTDAVRFAVELQNRVPEFDEGRPTDELIRLRVGVEIGDVVDADADSTGDGINVAVRLQSICPPGGICVSGAVHDHVQTKLKLAFERLGDVELKNIEHKVAAFVLRYRPGGVGAASPQARQRRRWTIGLGALLAIGAVSATVFGYAAWRATDPARAMPIVKSPSARPDFSFAVLPFVNLSGDPEQTYLADGISEDLTTDLSQVSGTVVIARESAFSYKGKQVDVRDIGRDLGVRYVIEGSVRKMGDSVRVNAQLVSGETGAHLWAKRFDQKLQELQGGMDGLAGEIADALGLKPAAASPRRRPAPSNSAAFDLVLRARSVMNEPRGPVRDAIALGLFEQALRLDPESVPAKAGVAAMLLQRSGSLKRASALIAQAEATAPDAPEVLAARFLLERTLRHWEESVATFRHLLAVDPSAAGIAAQSGRCPACWGQPDQAIPLLERVALLNPRSPNAAVIDTELGYMLLLAGRDPDAIRWLEAAAGRSGASDSAAGRSGSSAAETDDGTVVFARVLLGAAYALAGRGDDAHAAIAAALAAPVAMDYTLRSYERATSITANPELRRMSDRVMQGLRLAGLREHLDEAADSHVPSDARLRDIDQLDAPTPMTVPGGTTLLTDQLVALLDKEHPLVLTTASANPTIPGAVLLPITFGGSMDGEWQARLANILGPLTDHDRHRPIVTFAASINRWHARNLALRLIALGYDHVYWYRGGVEAWESRGLPMAPVIPRAEFSR